MNTYFKVSPFSATNKVTYFRVRADQIAEVDAYFADYEDENPSGYAEWTNDAVAHEDGVALAWEDRAYAGYLS